MTFKRGTQVLVRTASNVVDETGQPFWYPVIVTAGMSDFTMIDAMISPASPYSDQIRDDLEDLSSERDSAAQPWRVAE